MEIEILGGILAVFSSQDSTARCAKFPVWLPIQFPDSCFSGGWKAMRKFTQWALMIVLVTGPALLQSSASADSTSDDVPSQAEIKSKPSADAGKVIVKFNHYQDNEHQFYKKRLKDGERFVVRISQTDSTAFTYTIQGIEVVQETKSAPGEQIKSLPTDQVDLEMEHDERYGGYVVRIRRKAGKDSSPTLKDVDLIISVNTQKWRFSFSGAFTITGLTDPVYVGREVTQNGETYEVVDEEYSAQDEVALGVGAFAHVYHPTFPIGGAFGLGVTQQSITTYYLGLSYSLGEIVHLTAGPVFGPVARLPTGVSLGDSISSANDLSDLDTKIDVSWFVGITFGFLGSDEAFKKPFAGSKEE